MSATEPLTPPDCDLRGMPYMPLDIGRLFDSDLYVLSTGEEFKAALSLWGKAFLQVPAASLPNDDRILAHLSGSGARWAKVKEMALRGWVLCSDGRLYHPVVAEKARDAWQSRLDRRARTEAARRARHTSKADATDSGTEPPPHPVTISVTERATENVAASVTENVTSSKGSTREQKGTEVSKKEEGREDKSSLVRSRSLACRNDPEFAAFYAEYPKRQAPDDGQKAWRQVRKAGATAEEIMDGLRRHQFDPNPQFIPLPGSWLRAGRWKDEAIQRFASAWDQLAHGLEQTRLIIDHDEDDYHATH